jgi:hypothetical protein
MSWRLTESRTGGAYYSAYKREPDCDRTGIDDLMQSCDKILDQLTESLEAKGLDMEAYKGEVTSIVNSFVNDLTVTPDDATIHEWGTRSVADHVKTFKAYSDIIEFEVRYGVLWNIACLQQRNPGFFSVGMFDAVYKLQGDLERFVEAYKDKKWLPVELHYSRLSVILKNLVQAIDTRKAEALDPVNRPSQDQLMRHLIDDIKQVVTNIQQHVANPSQSLANIQLRTYTTDIFGNIVDGVTSYYPHFSK